MAETILIVDDEPFNVDLLEQELGDLGYETLTAFDGQAAVELVRQQRPDLVLLDVMMPVMDGFTACRLLKDDEATRLTPIIIMTALDRVEDRIKGIEAGADDFLTKPVNDQELLARIRTALRMKAAVDARVNEVTRLSDHFAKFVPEPVKRLATADPDSAELSGKVERDVSVLMLDVSGYSRLSEQLPTEQLNALVERYFSEYLDLIREADGDINETAGDGFMAIFLDGEGIGHATAEVRSALRLLERNGLIRRQRNEKDRRTINIFLTDSGKALKQDLLPYALEVNAVATAGLSPGEKAQLHEILSKIRDNLASEGE